MSEAEREGFYDEDGRYWDEDAEWCDRCQGLGIADCYCGGDQCYCENNGEMECPQCDGEGYFVPTAAFKAAREQNAKWWREYQERLATQAPTPDSQALATGGGDDE